MPGLFHFTPTKKVRSTSFFVRLPLYAAKRRMPGASGSGQDLNSRPQGHLAQRSMSVVGAFRKWAGVEGTSGDQPMADSRASNRASVQDFTAQSFRRSTIHSTAAASSTTAVGGGVAPSSAPGWYLPVLTRSAAPIPAGSPRNAVLRGLGTLSDGHLPADIVSHDTSGFMSAKVPVGLTFQAQTCSS